MRPDAELLGAAQDRGGGVGGGYYSGCQWLRLLPRVLIIVIRPPPTGFVLGLNRPHITTLIGRKTPICGVG